MIIMKKHDEGKVFSSEFKDSVDHKNHDDQRAINK